MTGDCKWKSTNRQFYSSGSSFVEILKRGSGRGRMVGEPMKELDRGAKIFVISMGLFAFVMLMAIDGLYAILWLAGAGPFSLALAAVVAQMGGVVWCRLVATGYAALLFIGLACCIAAQG